MSETTPLTSGEQAADVEKGGSAPTHRLNILFRIEDARKESTGPCDFLGKFFNILLDTVGFLIFVGILLAIPIAMIAVGSLNLDDCTVEPYIPIWLLVTGAVLAFQQLIYILRTSIGLGFIKDFTDEKVNKLYATFNILLVLFNIGWFIAGNVWVFSKYPPNIDDSAANDFCEPGVYYFSFSVIIVAYAWMLLTLCFSGCIACAGIKDIAHHVSNVATRGHGEPAPAESKE